MPCMNQYMAKVNSAPKLCTAAIMFNKYSPLGLIVVDIDKIVGTKQTPYFSRKAELTVS